MAANSIKTYDLKELTLEDLRKLIDEDKVFDIDSSLFREEAGSLLTNHFFDVTTPKEDIL